MEKVKKVKTFSNEFEKVFGADNQIRTGDLILTKDVLYQLSHISISSKLFKKNALAVARAWS